MSATYENDDLHLGDEYVRGKNRVDGRIRSMAAGFYQLDRSVKFANRHPEEIDEFVLKKEVVEMAEAGVFDPNDLKPPLVVPTTAIDRIKEMWETIDPLNLSEADLESLRTEVAEIVNSITIPTADQMRTFLSAFTELVRNAAKEETVLPANTREITLASTDTSLDAFVRRTRLNKAMAVSLNKLVYPYLTARFAFPSQLLATLSGTTGTKDDIFVDFDGITNEGGAPNVEAGSKVLITNNARHGKDLLQQKGVCGDFDEDNKKLRLESPLLFDLTSSHVVRLYLYTDDRILSVGEKIKIPK
ncbi:MAG: hypothetical protein GY866_00625 [Proteobacteria bacterium]|nr:hypothetical protein [Pseudomonadota bacterium]